MSKSNKKSVKEIFDKNDIDILGAEDAVRGLPLHQQIVSGSLAGMCEHLGLFPVDTIKVGYVCIIDPYASI